MTTNPHPPVVSDSIRSMTVLEKQLLSPIQETETDTDTDTETGSEPDLPHEKMTAFKRENVIANFGSSRLLFW